MNVAAAETHGEWLERMYACRLRRALPGEAELVPRCDEEIDLDREVIYRSVGSEAAGKGEEDREGTRPSWEAHALPPLLRRQSGFHNLFA